MTPRFVIQYRMEKKANRDRPEQTIERGRILVGARPISDVYVPDRLVPQEAFELAFDGRRLEIAVKGRIAGVFVDGVPVEGTGLVAHGAAIQCGACLVEVSIDETEHVCRLVVGERYLTAAVAALAKKAPAPFTLEESGPQEQRWGRSPVLRTWSWIAAFAGIACLAAFPFVRDTEAVNRGTLSKGHAIGSAYGPSDCSGCHAPFASDYGPRCTVCHEDYDADRHHPYARVAEFACAECHSEHRGADANLLPPMDAGASGWPRACERCHADQDRVEKERGAGAASDVAAKSRDRLLDPVERWLQVDGFSHADHRIAKEGRASLCVVPSQPRGDVPVPCAKCHERRVETGATAGPDEGGATAATATADFALVAYETCLGCHAEWRVDAHGRDGDGVHCFQCHTKTSDVAAIGRAIRTADVAATGSLYELTPRRHDFAKDDCRACHVESKAAAARTEPVRMAFRHDHHVRTVAPERGGELALAASCVPCHAGVAESASLAGLGATLPVAGLDACGTCHTEGAPTPVPGSGRRTVVDMFHSVHTVEPGTTGALRALADRESLSKGCLSCHVPAAGTERMGLREGVADCSGCHKAHENLGGGRCALCHVDRRSPANRDDRGRFLYRANEAGIFAREKATLKRTAPVRWFDHFSPGHAVASDDPAGAGCATCHDAKSVDSAERVADVAWPGATDPSCVVCHVRTRYHR